MDEEDDDDAPPPPRGRHMTAATHARLADELRALLREERPRVVEIVSWAAGNGDRSENGDYQYGKKRLREIDRRVRFLRRRIEAAIVVNPSAPADRSRVFFGARVTYADAAGRERTVTILGEDEADASKGVVSTASPIARALIGARVGDEVRLATPRGVEPIEVVAIRYGQVGSGAGDGE